MGARLVRLGITGFKSFADATAIDILPGLTGVVGPNGCGKSNVAEALRWAMGESSARSLRGGEMDDVIFAGAATRPGRNLAEVSLHLEAGPGALPAPFAAHAELQVTRRIERGTGSSYRVNGREARARDVQTLFADLASGSRSSAMVSQGRVGALVSARPEERRAVLEEAAGVAGLHSRRAEAETRLRAAEANLARAEDRRLALERQAEALRGQAKQAARYRTVTEAVLETEALVLATQHARAVAARDAGLAAHAEASARLAAHTRGAEAATRAAEAAAATLPGLREAEAAARSALDQAQIEQEGTAARAAGAAAARTAAGKRLEQLRRDTAHAEGQVRDHAGAGRRLDEEAARLSVEAERHPAALEAAAAEARTAAEALRTADAEAAGTAARAAEAAAVSGALRQALEQAGSRLRRAEEAWSRLQGERARLASGAVDSGRVDAAARAHVAAQAGLAAARQALDAAEAGRGRAATLAASARDAHGRADAARQKLAAQVSALAELLAVKDHERWPPMLDRLAVAAGLEAALGAALGEELAAADDPAAARHWRDLGGTEPPPLPAPALSDAVAGPPALGRALSAVGLVESDAAGDAGQLALRPGQSLVSRAGAVWRWDGYTVRAGTPNMAAVRLQQRNRLAGLQTQLAEAEQVADAARTARDQAAAAERTATEAEQAARTAGRAAEQAAERAAAEAQSLQARASTAIANLAAIDVQLGPLAPERAAAQQDHAAARTAHDARPDPAALTAAANQARAAVAAARMRDNAASRALDALQRAGAGRAARIAGIGREREDRQMRAADLSGRVTDLSARLREAEAEHARLSALPSGEAAAGRAAATVAAAMAAHGAALASRDAAEQQAATAASAARAAEQAAYAARESLVRAEVAQAAAAGLTCAAEDRIAERAGALPPLPAVTDPSQAAEDRARGRLTRLTRERDELGPVNLRAEIEQQAIQADLDATVRDAAELQTAIAKLRGGIGHLNREGRERLTAVFQDVDRQFQALFARVFGGGRAHLALVGSDDPLEAGLEIYAQPPGKKLSALSLLSGGEQALTALSLVFAVFRCNPAPLCVLDEVDAPLDDANVDRLCLLLSDMVQETGTRFLVVTHHQLTMARMDRLYGVTMQERGVSRLLSVNLSEAQAQVAEKLAAE